MEAMFVDGGYLGVTLTFLLGVMGPSSFTDATSSCEKPLGLENGEIIDDQFEFLDESYAGGYLPTKARLNGQGCYCTPYKNYEAWFPYIYFTINLTAKYEITGLALQKGPNGYPAVSSMKLFTYTNGKELLYNESAIKLPKLEGNKDDIEHVNLKPTVAEKIRMQFQGSENHNCIRMELYGCLHTETGGTNVLCH